MTSLGRRKSHCPSGRRTPVPTGPADSDKTFSNIPTVSSARRALAHNPTPAPTSKSSGACSYSSTSMPDPVRATAVVAPPMPQPMITAFNFVIHSGFDNSGGPAKVATLSVPLVLAPLLPMTSRDWAASRRFKSHGTSWSRNKRVHPCVRIGPCPLGFSKADHGLSTAIRGWSTRSLRKSVVAVVNTTAVPASTACAATIASMPLDNRRTPVRCTLKRRWPARRAVG
jgi:hypothetical protein